MNRLLKISTTFFSTVQKKLQYSFKSGWAILPHPQKEDKGGQDAVFANKSFLVVADGVGGWADSGIDPGLYSKKLVSIIQQLVTKQPFKYIQDPKSLINEAVNLNQQTGSTTVCVLTLHPQSGVVKSYYLGDSVYAIINEQAKSIKIVPDQQIQFNFPVQVGTNGHSPLSGVYQEYQKDEIKPEEIIVVGTDGLWDNIDADLIFAVGVGKVWDVEFRELGQRAQMMTLAVRQAYCNPQEYQSPFYLKAKQAGLRYPKQGKPDDTSIIVAQIIQEQL